MRVSAAAQLVIVSTASLLICWFRHCVRRRRLPWKLAQKNKTKWLLIAIEHDVAYWAKTGNKGMEKGIRKGTKQRHKTVMHMYH
jgi:hypothetical protein